MIRHLLLTQNEIVRIMVFLGTLFYHPTMRPSTPPHGGDGMMPVRTAVEAGWWERP